MNALQAYGIVLAPTYVSASHSSLMSGLHLEIDLLYDDDEFNIIATALALRVTLVKCMTRGLRSGRSTAMALLILSALVH
jgi:hypothetical protein